MNIVIDIRPLMGGKVSGVETYILNLLENLFQIDTSNTYILFANGSKEQKLYLPYYQGQNVNNIQTLIPNKLLNLSLRFLRWPKLDGLILQHFHKHPQQKPLTMKKMSIDLFLMPDLRLSALSKNVKKITVVHDLSFHHFPQFFSTRTQLWHKLLNPKREIKESDHIIAVSDFTKKDLMRTYHLDATKIEVIKEGVNENFGENIGATTIQAVQQKYGLPHKYLLFLSTLEPRKNIQGLIKGFKLFRKNNPASTIKLAIAGKTNHKIFSPIKTATDADIIFPGFIDEKDKAALIKGAKVFLYPSLFEGFGLPLLEAMKCAVPIITSNRSSMPEIVGESALLVDPEDTGAIAKAIATIQKPSVQQELKQKMANQIKKFSWHDCATRTLELMEKVFNEKS